MKSHVKKMCEKCVFFTFVSDVFHTFSHASHTHISHVSEKLHGETCVKRCVNGPFATNGHMIQNPPYWKASSLLFPHWDIKTKASQA